MCVQLHSALNLVYGFRDSLQGVDKDESFLNFWLVLFWCHLRSLCVVILQMLVFIKVLITATYSSTVLLLWLQLNSGYFLLFVANFSFKTLLIESLLYHREYRGLERRRICACSLCCNGKLSQPTPAEHVCILFSLMLTARKLWCSMIRQKKITYAPKAYERTVHF